ncbi:MULTISPECIES: pyrroline-5-carboxylate reductase [Butyrivibrio]|jgi:pyrroline-5-carboxylate reductase|uniref:pyrroline-5-carboxylate reductase n=1 Tax=Butyrivibrio TaxID=830 RepID=UPI0003B4B86C|nr:MULTISPECIES: pyrroline-5-carboxylate reductase [Butyrivibrio]SEP69700.1 pyrroline-5-carboxylate reductase [Butyrivibrio sp. TB]
MVIGFIGLGNMAKAMIGGILKKDIVSCEDIIGSAATKKTCEKVSEKFGIQTRDSNRKVAKEADVIILAVKPQYFTQVIAEIMDDVDEDKLVISIAAGKTLKWIEGAFEKRVKLIRVMPNTPALVGEGCTAVCRNELVSDEELAFAMTIFESFGQASVVNENLMDVVGGVSGSSPAYAFMFIEAMADAAVEGGMPRKQAYQFAAQSLLGSAKMVLETGKHPGELKDMVCSPGGTTIAAVRVLEEKGFRGAVIDAIKACIDKTKQL